MRSTAVMAAALGIVVLAGACFEQNAAFIEHPLIVLPVGREPPSLYLTAWNMSADSDTVVAVEVEMARLAYMYRFRDHALPESDANVNDLSALELVHAVPMGPWARADFDVNGAHARLFGLRRRLVRGDSTAVTIHFARHKPATAIARIIAYAELDSAITAQPTATTGWLRRPKVATPRSAPGSTRRDAPTVAQGAALFRANGCASCHGQTGHGDGPVGSSLVTKPRDFRDEQAFRNGTDVASIAQTIATGIVSNGTMPRFPHLSQSERESLALFVRSILPQRGADVSPNTPSPR